MSIQYITIPVPMPTVRARGIHANGVFAESKTVKISRIEMQRIRVASQILGITTSEFIRWCAVYSAKQITETNR